jgi:hypothetical protein
MDCAAVCGDGCCTTGEDCASCPSECGDCPDITAEVVDGPPDGPGPDVGADVTDAAVDGPAPDGPGDAPEVESYYGCECGLAGRSAEGGAAWLGIALLAAVIRRRGRIA